MQPIVAAFWGAFFGTAVLMIAGAVAAYVRAMRRVTLTAATTGACCSVLVGSYIGLFPIEDASLQLRVNGSLFVVGAGLLGHLMAAMIGYLREPLAARQWRTALYAYSTLVMGISWLLPDTQGFLFCTVAAFAVGLSALVFCVWRASHGDRMASLAIVAAASICVLGAMLTWIAIAPPAPWGVHAVGAVSAVMYLCSVAVVLWLRFSFLFELRQVIAYGQSYDPITRMRTHSETGQMVGLAFFSHAQQGERIGVMAILIGNMSSVEKLHGRAAVNHGLFVSAGRLRRTLPSGAEVGRLGEDGFLVLIRDVRDKRKVLETARVIVQRMSRPVVLSTSTDLRDIENGQAHWVAQVGVGIVIAEAGCRPSDAIARARGMSQAALGFPSRVAWQDHGGRVTEAPQLAAA